MSEPQRSEDVTWKQYIDAARDRIERLDANTKSDPAGTLADAAAEIATLLRAIRIASKSLHE